MLKRPARSPSFPRARPQAGRVRLRHVRHEESHQLHGDAYDALRPAPDFDFPLAPVTITQGAAGAPDTLTTFYGNSPLIVAGKAFTFSGTTAKQTSSSLGGRTGLMKGDVLLIAGQVGAALECQLVEVTDNTSADAVTINHGTGSYTPENSATGVTARYNKATAPAFVNGFITTRSRADALGPGRSRPLTACPALSCRTTCAGPMPTPTEPTTCCKCSTTSSTCRPNTVSPPTRTATASSTGSAAGKRRRRQTCRACTPCALPSSRGAGRRRRRR